MSLNQGRRSAIDTAILAGVAPKIGRPSQTTLALRQNPGRSSYVLLGRPHGSLTSAGEYNYTPSQTERPSAQFDPNTPLIKRGSSDYITTGNGKQALVRTLRTDGTYQVTRLGRLYFRNSETEYVVSIPAIVRGQNAKGKVQNRKTTLPVDMPGIGRILRNTTEPEAMRIARVKSYVLSQLQIRTQNGMSVIMEVSGETLLYDREGEWLISSLTTEMQGTEGRDQRCNASTTGCSRKLRSFLTTP